MREPKRSTMLFILLCLLSSATVLSLISCAANMPKTFVQAFEPGWASIELRQDVDREQAWQTVVDILARRFELEVISKDGMYVRTAWLYTWWKVGEVTDKYRVRAVVKFAPDMKTLDIKTEAHFLKDKQWLVGYDTRMLETIKTDIAGTLGRTAG
ncbi:MAG: hypothetical protein KAT58_00520 [candidate division Zixibacteria bacterium]|nr:hypothetical protein [candidate division Zixibacteria bacterium]